MDLKKYDICFVYLDYNVYGKYVLLSIKNIK